MNVCVCACVRARARAYVSFSLGARRFFFAAQERRFFLEPAAMISVCLHAGGGRV